MRRFMIALLAIFSLVNVAQAKVNVDDFIKEKENFVCESKAAKAAFDNLIREEFGAKSTIDGNLRTLESLQGLVDDQELFAQIQTVLVVGPAAGIVGYAGMAALYAQMSTFGVLSASWTVAQIDSGTRAGILLMGFIGTLGTFGASYTIGDLLSDLEEDSDKLESFYHRTKRLDEADKLIEQLQDETPEISLNLLEEYVGWVGYKKLRTIVDNKILHNRLLQMKLRDIEFLKESLKNSCY